MEADDTQRLRELRQVVYREFVEEGRPPAAAEAARRLRLGVEEVLAGWGRLHDQHALVLDADRVEVRMAHPFSARPMHFVVASAEQKWWGGCAWDSFGIMAALGQPVLVATTGHVEAWAAAAGEPVGAVVDLATMWRLGTVWYEDRLHDDHRRRTPEEATAVFAELGLTGPFWDMAGPAAGGEAG